MFLTVSLVCMVVFVQYSVLMSLGFWLSLSAELPFDDGFGFAAIGGTLLVFVWFLVGPISILAATVCAIVGAVRSNDSAWVGIVQAVCSVALGIGVTYVLFTT